MAWDPEGYYEDPYQGWDPYQYYDPYADYGFYQDEPQGDTESEKLRKNQERREALESNRLYLKKVQKQCVKEDFADLDKLQLFLFEVLIEALDAEGGSDLGLVLEDEPAYLAARVQFLNAPYLEICEKEMMMEGPARESEERHTDYMQVISNGGLQEAYSTSAERPQAGPPEEHTIKWEQSSGKSCLFSMTALEVIQKIEQYPVNVQVARCVTTDSGPENCEPLGYASLRLPDDFSLSVIQSCKTGVILPVSCVHRHSCDLRNVFGVKKGTVDVFLRLSCFGPVIVTSFQTAGDDRHYAFKPSPLSSIVKESEDGNELHRSEPLKPIIAEEDRACGITVQKDQDIFQRPVLWKKGALMCGCDEEGECFFKKNVEKLSNDTSRLSIRLPLSSDISLCRNVQSKTDRKDLKQFGKPLCDWHNLVSLEIKNGPGGNCGCLDEGIDTTRQMGRRPSRISYEVSRIQKMRPVKRTLTDTGLKNSGDCQCDCPDIRDFLRNNKVFKN